MKINPSVTSDGRIFYANMMAVLDAWCLDARPDEGIISSDPRKLTPDLMQKLSTSISRDGTKAAFIAFGGALMQRFEPRRRL